MDMSIEVVPTVRDPDGLALSSRNTYLSEEQRQWALVLYRALKSCQEMYKSGNTCTDTLLAHGKNMIEQVSQATDRKLTLDYLSINGQEFLEPLKKVPADGAILSGAIFLHGEKTVRLIDNLILSP